MGYVEAHRRLDIMKYSKQTSLKRGQYADSGAVVTEDGFCKWVSNGGCWYLICSRITVQPLLPPACNRPADLGGGLGPCLEAENEKRVSTSRGLVDRPSFLGQKALSCFQKLFLCVKNLRRAASTRHGAAAAQGSACGEPSAARGWHARLNFSFSDKAAEFCVSAGSKALQRLDFS